jgi:hypothetical protein
LKLIVELPTVKKVSDVNLEVTCFNVEVEVPDKYYLYLMLPYEVQDNDGCAKFDKAKQTLTLELPVKPKPPDMAMLEAANRMSAGIVECDDTKDGALSEGKNASDDEDLPPLEDPPSLVEPPPVLDPEPEVPIAQNETRGEWLECEASSSLQIASAGLAAGGTTEEERLDGRLEISNQHEDDREFIPSDFWDGARPGYAFKLGDAGLGYYVDSRQPRQSTKKKEVLLRRPEEKSEEKVMPSSAFVTEVKHPLQDKASFTPAERVTALGPALRSYLDDSASLNTKLVAGDFHEGSDELVGKVDWHQTRQNLVLILDIPNDREVRGLQLLLSDRSMVLSFGIRPRGAGQNVQWHRQLLRQVLMGLVDPQQWHADLESYAPAGGKVGSPQRRLVVVLRKVDQTELWPDAFDKSASLEPMLAFKEEEISKTPSRNENAAYQTAADTDGSVGAPGIAVSRDDRVCADVGGTGGAPLSSSTAGFSGPVDSLVDVAAADDSAALDAAAPIIHASDATRDTVEPVVPAATIAQSAAVMGQSVQLKSRLMYQLL